MNIFVLIDNGRSDLGTFCRKKPNQISCDHHVNSKCKHKMAAEDAFLREILYYRIGPSLIICYTIYYFRSFIKHHTYDRIYARLLNRYGQGMNKAFKSEKTEIFDNLSKLKTNLNRNLSVMEIGAGSAPNIHLFPADTEIVCLEPNPHFNKYIEKNLKSTKTEISEVTVIQGYAEDINAEDERFDAVVCTFVLCTVESPSKSLSEIKRVLKPVSMPND